MPPPDEPLLLSVAPARLASSVVLVRTGERGLELFWVRRGAQLRFAGGFHAFPGGRVDAADASLPLRSAAALGAEEASSIAAAARELFEETGVLAVPGAERISSEERREVRLALTARPSRGAPGSTPAAAPASESSATPFARMLARHHLTTDAALFLPAGRWITPRPVPTRFDTRFYLCLLPAGERAEVWPGELADGAWVTPAQALARWASGEALLHPPAWHTLRCLQQAAETSGDARDALALLQEPERASWRLPIRDFIVERMEFQRGVVMVPLRTPTLPPATHTNCLMLGDSELLIVDPGSPWPEEQAQLSLILDGLAAQGRSARAILLTHHHIDHVAGAMRLSRERTLPILAHPATAAQLGDEVRVDRLLEDGEELPFGPRGWRAMHLPGHTRGHLCLLEHGSASVVAGDLVAGQSTVVIDPPEGDMGDYLRSLERLLGHTPRTLYPAHGQVIPTGEEHLRALAAHRLAREAKVLAALQAAAAPALPRELLALAYDDVQPALHLLAERSLLAHLLKLVQDGRARSDAQGKFIAA